MATYSAFFSSGLLAPPMESVYVFQDAPLTTPSSQRDDPFDEPIRSDVGMYDGNSTPVGSPTAETDSPCRPRIRRRRSSLSLGSLNTLKSPILAASSALQFSRSRGNSISNATSASANAGRMRSGSVGTATLGRPRRILRRPPTHPPPSMPLPLPPLTAQSARPPLAVLIPAQDASGNVLSADGLSACPSSKCSSPVGDAVVGRNRSYSIDSVNGTIEEVKEN